MQLYLTLLYIVKVLKPEDDPLLLKLLAEINTIDNTVVCFHGFLFFNFITAQFLLGWKF